MNHEIEKWIKKIQSGNPEYFNKIVERYAKLIFSLLYEMTNNYEDTKDLTQETFLKAFKNIGTYEGKSKFDTWLYRIAYNVGIDYWRRQRKRRFVDIDSIRKIDQAYSGRSNNNLYTGLNEVLQKGLQQLTQRQRAAVVLSYFHGFTIKEIGSVLGCSEATVRVHIFRAFNKLRKELKGFKKGE